MKMSKKQNQKKKINIKVLPGQAVYVCEVEILQHISELYRTMSEQAQTEEDRLAWLQISEEVNQAIFDTYYNPEDTYDEEW